MNNTIFYQCRFCDVKFACESGDAETTHLCEGLAPRLAVYRASAQRKIEASKMSGYEPTAKEIALMLARAAADCYQHEANGRKLNFKLSAKPTKCGPKCWGAKREDCGCECEGENHGRQPKAA